MRWLAGLLAVALAITSPYVPGLGARPHDDGATTRIRNEDAPPPALSMRAQLGGFGSFGLTIAGRYGYLTAGPRLTVLDITERAVIRPMGSLMLPGFVRQVVVSGTLAYVAVGGAGISIVDVSDPARPRAIGSVGTTDSSSGLVLSGVYLYVADGAAGLRVVDVADPMRPQSIASIPAGARVSRVVISDQDVAYTLAPSGEVHVIDLADPRAPLDLGQVDTGGLSVGAMAVAGTKLYATDSKSANGTLRILDIAYARRPRLMGTLELKDAGAITIHGQLAFVMCADTVCLVDVSDPAHPVHVGSHRERGYIDGGIMAGAVAALGTEVYLLTYSTETALIRVIDVADPSAPRDLGAYGGFSFIQSMTTSGKLAYLIGGADEAGDQLLKVVDVHDPLQPLELSTTLLPTRHSRIAISGRTAALIHPEGLNLMDVGDPRRPVLRGSLAVDDAEGLAVAGPLAYLGAAGRVRIVDIGNPANPKEVGSCLVEDFPSSGNDLAVLGPWLAVASRAKGLLAYDVSVASDCRLLGSTPLAETPLDLLVHDGTAYLAGARSGLAAVDLRGVGGQLIRVSIESNPARRLTSDGAHLYVASDGHLRIFDLTDSQQPSLRQRLPLPSYFKRQLSVRAMNVVGDRVLVHDGNRLLSFDTRLREQVAPYGGLGLGNIAWYAERVWAKGAWALVNSRPTEMRLIHAEESTADEMTFRESSLHESAALDAAFVGDDVYVLREHVLDVLDLGSPNGPRIISRRSPIAWGRWR